MNLWRFKKYDNYASHFSALLLLVSTQSSLWNTFGFDVRKGFATNAFKLFSFFWWEFFERLESGVLRNKKPPKLRLNIADKNFFIEMPQREKKAIKVKYFFRDFHKAFLCLCSRKYVKCDTFFVNNVGARMQIFMLSTEKWFNIKNVAILRCFKYF